MTLSVEYLARYRVLPDARWEGAVARGFTGYEDLTGTRLVLHDFTPPTRPVLYATNSTQKYDFLTFRSAMARARQKVVTVTKAKNYHVTWMRPILERTGVIPLASKGYVLLHDAVTTLGRRPTEDEYRALRDHLDGRAALPTGGVYEALQGRPRSILGVDFNPSRETVSEAWQGVYARLLGEAVRFAREAVAADYAINIYPEGTVSRRLGTGRAGVMQFAKALGVEVVPVGMSGCPEVFRGASPLLRGGTVDLRFGAAYRPDLDALGDDFTAFHPAYESRHRATLQAATDDLMVRLDALLAPDYQRQEGFVSDGTRGTRRFL